MKIATETPYKYKTRGYLWITIPILIVFILSIGKCITLLNQSIKGNRLKELNIIVEAQITGWHRVEGSGTLMTAPYSFYYRYVDENGLVYEGDSTNRIIHGLDRAIEVVESGAKIEIYIDGQGNSMAICDVSDTSSCITVTVIFSVLGVLFVIIFFIPHKVPLEKVKRRRISRNDIKDE